jgi:hypothetical protein
MVLPCWQWQEGLYFVQVLLADGTVVPLTAEAKKKIMAEVDGMAAKALRCLALAQKTDLPNGLSAYDGDSSHPVRLPAYNSIFYTFPRPVASDSSHLMRSTSAEIPFHQSLLPPCPQQEPGLGATFLTCTYLVCPDSAVPVWQPESWWPSLPSLH